MYAYRTHTKCMQAHRKRKREEFLFLLPFISFYIARPFLFTARVFGHVRTPLVLLPVLYDGLLPVCRLARRT